MSRDLSHFIDLESLPLRSPGNDQYQALVAGARQALASDGCYVLPGAIRDKALREMQAEARSIENFAHYTPNKVNVYFSCLLYTSDAADE